MVEVWFKYGKTEVSVDIPPDVDYEIVEHPTPSRSLDGLTSFIEEHHDILSQEKRIVIGLDYVAGLNGYLESVQTLLSSMKDIGVDPSRVELVVSGWRYFANDLEGEFAKEVLSHVRQLGAEKVYAFSERRTYEKLEGEVVLFAPTMAWGREVLGLNSFWRCAAHQLSSIEDLLAVTPVVGRGGYVEDVICGRLEFADEKARTLVVGSSTVSVNLEADVVVVGGNGYPMDHTLSSCLHVPLSLEGLEKRAVVILAAECSAGLGPKYFVEELLRPSVAEERAEDPLVDEVRKRLRFFREFAVDQRLCMVTVLPRIYVERFLGARRMDSIDEALSYAWRLKSKQAKVLAVPNTLGSILKKTGQKR